MKIGNLEAILKFNSGKPLCHFCFTHSNIHEVYPLLCLVILLAFNSIYVVGLSCLEHKCSIILLLSMK